MVFMSSSDKIPFPRSTLSICIDLNWSTASIEVDLESRLRFLSSGSSKKIYNKDAEDRLEKKIS